jgi:Single-stranded DNA binding protein Ssb-like, OB fold
LSRKSISTTEYLAILSAKYDVDPDKFFSALALAEEDKRSKCGDFAIECRSRTQEKVMFLILRDSKVVAQFSVQREFLLDQGHPIRNLMDTQRIRRFAIKKAVRSLSLTIKDLKSGMKKVSLKARVLEIPKPSTVCTRYGTFASVTNALIADRTGTIRLCLWNEQIGSISTGDTIQIENGRTSTFRGQRQLNIGRNGLLSSIEDSSFQMEEPISS